MLARMPKPAQPPAEVAATIRVVRGQRVILDSDLAELYGVSTRRLNEQVRRNLQRFPGDFLIDPTNQDLAILKSHNATSSWGGRGCMMPSSASMSRTTRPRLSKIRAVVDAMERDMATTIATKADLQLLRSALHQESALIRQECALLRKAMEIMAATISTTITLRTGSMLVVAIGLLFAALKLT